MNQNQPFLTFNSVENIPDLKASAAFTVNSAEVFKEQTDIVPVKIDEGYEYMPWGADNEMPYKILELIESDETLSTCQIFNAEVCYGSGLVYDTADATKAINKMVDHFLMENDLASYFLGVCQDFKYFGFCVSVIILSNDGMQIVRILRKEACYCRFAPAKTDGTIPYILYANWRKCISSKDDVEKIELLDFHSPWADLQERMQAAKGKRPKTSTRKFAIVSRVPTPDSTYYPIPYYGSLFKGNWYNIKKLIGMAKEAKLKNSAPIKYHIEIANRYWDGIFKSEAITDRKKQQERIVEEKEKIINFLTGMENSGKALFSRHRIGGTDLSRSCSSHGGSAACCPARPGGCFPRRCLLAFVPSRFPESVRGSVAAGVGSGGPRAGAYLFLRKGSRRGSAYPGGSRHPDASVARERSKVFCCLYPLCFLASFRSVPRPAYLCGTSFLASLPGAEYARRTFQASFPTGKPLCRTS